MSEQNRVLYFEIVAGVHLFQQATDAAKNHYRSLTENIKTLQADLNANVKAKLEDLAANYASKADVIEKKIEQLYEDWDSITAETVSKNIAQIEKWKKAQLAAIEEVKARSLEQAGSTGLVSASGGNLVNTAAQEQAIALYEKQREEIEQLAAARLADARSATSANATVIAALEAQELKLRELQAQYAMLFVEEEATMKGAASQGLTKAAAAMGTLYNGAMTAIPVIGAVGLVLGGVYAILDKVTMSAAAYAMKIVQLGAVTGLTDQQLNNTYHTLQVYNDLFQYFGLQQEQVNMAFTRFSRTLESGGNNLAQYGIHASNMNDLLVQLSDKITKTTDDAQKQNIVLAALGVTGGNVGGSIAGMAEQITAALNIGNPAIKAYGENMTALGLIMDNTQLQAGAAADAIHGQMTLALQGLERQVGEKLFPEMDALWLMIASGAKGASGAISSIATAVANVMGAVLGFLFGLFGVSQKDLHDMIEGARAGIKAASQAAADQANAQNSAAGAVQNTKDQIKGLTEADKRLQQQQADRDRAATIAQQNLDKAVRDQTRAIDDQIKALEQYRAAQNQAMDDQVRDLENVKTNLEDQLKLEDDLHQSYLAQLQDQLDMAKDVDERKMHSNETLVDYQRRMYELNLQDAIKTEDGKRKTAVDTLQQQIDLLKQQTDAKKEELDKQTQAEINALQTQKQGLQDYLSDRRNAMQNELDRERDAVSSQVQANEAKIQELQQVSNQSFDGMASNVGINAADIERVMNTTLTQIENGAAGSGLTAGKNIRDGIENFLMDPGGSLRNDAVQLGSVIAGGLWQGLMSNLPSITDILAGIVLPGMNSDSPNMPHGKQQVQDLINYMNSQNGHEDGGVITTPMISKLGEGYKPEVVIPLTKPSRAASLMAQTGLDKFAGGGSGGSSTTVNFNGPVADALVGARVADNIVQIQKKNQLRYGAGL